MISAVTLELFRSSDKSYDGVIINHFLWSYMVPYCGHIKWQDCLC